MLHTSKGSKCDKTVVQGAAAAACGLAAAACIVAAAECGVAAGCGTITGCTMAKCSEIAGDLRGTGDDATVTIELEPNATDDDAPAAYNGTVGTP